MIIFLPFAPSDVCECVLPDARLSLPGHCIGALVSLTNSGMYYWDAPGQEGFVYYSASLKCMEETTSVCLLFGVNIRVFMYVLVLCSCNVMVVRTSYVFAFLVILLAFLVFSLYFICFCYSLCSCLVKMLKTSHFLHSYVSTTFIMFLSCKGGTGLHIVFLPLVSCDVWLRIYNSGTVLHLKPYNCSTDQSLFVRA